MDPSNPFGPSPKQKPSNQIIIHIDMDCFYVSCERLRDPILIDQPVIVGMNYTPGESRGAVATASYEA